MDLYRHNGRRPYHSINFVTAHDGFTLRDLVSYNTKHNEANGEDNRDGDEHNNSWNCGVEGPTDDPAIRELRLRQMRNFLATLLLSQGTPMLLAGDERGRTQQGNNNAYCQDNSLSWVDWSPDPEAEHLLAFTRSMIALRRRHPSLRRRNFFQGRWRPSGWNTMWSGSVLTGRRSGRRCGTTPNCAASGCCSTAASCASRTSEVSPSTTRSS